MNERLSIKEELHIVIRDTNTGEIIKRKKVYPRWYHSLPRSLLKLLQRLPLVPHLTNSPSTTGLDHAANFWGGTGSPLAINQIGADGTPYVWKTATISGPATEGTGKCKVDNELNPWTTADTYIAVACRNSGEGGSPAYHNSITFTVTIAANQEWWVEIMFTFS
jgi:hypothetical protein